MASKVIAQLIVQGVSVFSRAFVSAYQQALHNAKSGGGGAAAAAASATRVTKFKMQPDEALKILNIENKAALSQATLQERYDKLFHLNDPNKGGSFYLQSKIYRAKQALDYELTKDQVPPASESSNTTSTEGKTSETNKKP